MVAVIVLVDVGTTDGQQDVQAGSKQESRRARGKRGERGGDIAMGR